MSEHVVIPVSGLAEKRRAIAAFNGTIDVIRRQRPEGWERMVEYLESVRFRVVEGPRGLEELFPKMRRDL